MKKPGRKLLYALAPTKLSSKLAYLLSRWKHVPFRDWLARKLIALYGVRMDEAAEPDYTNRDAYPDLNSIFTRALRPGVRPMSPDGTISSPVDGTISQIDLIRDKRIIQAKQHDFSVTELLGGDVQLAERFRNGHFTTIYLSPRDYHRVHMPVSGKLTETIHIPGRLMSVAPSWIRNVPGLFAKNERLACLFDTELGPVAVVLVGAINVGSIETVWSGQVTPPYARKITRTRYADGASIKRGEEMGRFNMGSTVILLFAENRISWRTDKQADQHLAMGEAIGDIVTGT
jgi:phosphatidylserine decarboxylase